jgi:hypothetical protein
MGPKAAVQYELPTAGIAIRTVDGVRRPAFGKP